MMPVVGAVAPDFTLPDQDSTPHTLSKLQGTWVLVYFYPKDDTPGCTKEACAIQDADPDLSSLGAVVLGISADSVASHKKFAQKYSLAFPLLSDESKETINAYGVWGDKKFMGKEYQGILRTSFLIRPDGTIAKVYESVKPEQHALEVLADLKAFQAA